MNALAHPIQQPPVQAHVDSGNCQSCGGVFRASMQLWSCLKCGRIRIWGYRWPSDRALLPLLNCDGCGEPERHGFIGVAGR